MPMTKKEKADAMKRLQNLNAFMAKVSPATPKAKSPATPKRTRRSVPPTSVPRSVSPKPVRRRAASVPAAFGPMLHPQGWVQPMQVQKAARLSKQEQQYEAAKAAKAAANRQRKQTQHAELRSRAYNSASADVKKTLDFLSAHGDLSTFNKLMDKLAQQQEQRQVAQRLAKAKQQEQGLKTHGVFKWGLMSAAKAREERAAAKAKVQTQAAQAAKAKAQAARLSPVALPGQSAQAFKLRLSQNAMLARKAAVAARKAQTQRAFDILSAKTAQLAQKEKAQRPLIQL